MCVKFTGEGSVLPANKLEQVVTRQSASQLRGKVSLLLDTLSQSEQQANSMFCCKLGKSATETLVSLKMISDDQALKNPLCTTDNQFKNGKEY